MKSGGKFVDTFLRGLPFWAKALDKNTDSCQRMVRLNLKFKRYSCAKGMVQGRVVVLGHEDTPWGRWSLVGWGRRPGRAGVVRVGMRVAPACHLQPFHSLPQTGRTCEQASGIHPPSHPQTNYTDKDLPHGSTIPTPTTHHHLPTTHPPLTPTPTTPLGR